MTNQSIINQILETKPPNTLYHYTSSVGLQGMLKSKKIWTTKVHFLNDNSELQLALDYIRKEISLRLDYIRKGISLQKENYKTRTDFELKTMLAHLDSMETSNISVVSFTEEGDQLSQWRGYCKIGNGYSLGFNSERLINVVNSYQGYNLVRCSYEKQEHELIAEEIVNSAPVIEITEHPSYGKAPFFQMDFMQSVSSLAPIIKSESFKEEKEWRLISPAMSYAHAEFRHGNHSLIPYWEFNLDLENTLKEIIIGPTPEPKLSSDAVFGLIFKEIKNLGNRHNISQHIKHSNIPFRQM